MKAAMIHTQASMCTCVYAYLYIVSVILCLCIYVFVFRIARAGLSLVADGRLMFATGGPVDMGLPLRLRCRCRPGLSLRHRDSFWP